MIAALWANGNLEPKDRREVIDGIETNFEEAMWMIDAPPEQEVEMSDANNQFIAAAQRGVAKLEQPADANVKVREVVDYTKDIDQ